MAGYNRENPGVLKVLMARHIENQIKDIKAPPQNSTKIQFQIVVAYGLNHSIFCCAAWHSG